MNPEQNEKPPIAKRPRNNNPYEVLIFAAPFLIGGVMLLMQHGVSPIVGAAGGKFATGFQILAMSEAEAHSIGIVCLLLGFVITLCYFRLRKQIKRDASFTDERDI